MLGGVGLPEILIVAAIAALIFGPSRLPKLGRSIGESIREFRNVGKEIANGWDDTKDAVKAADRDVREATRLK